MCSGRVDLKFVLRALMKGMDGVFIGACRLNECNYVTHGNYDALNMVLLTQKIMAHIGLDPQRLDIEFMSGGEGHLFVQVINKFSKKIRELGPLGQSEGLDKNKLQLKLQAVHQLVPYVKLVEWQSLKAHGSNAEEYHDFFQSDQVDQIFEELIADKLAMSQIMLLLREKPQSTAEISKRLGLNPSQTSRHMKESAKQGLVRYDIHSMRYAMA